jgi:hypothetical protein
MKKLIIILVFSIVLLSCNRNKIDESLIEGKWEFNINDRLEIFTFKEGLYSNVTIQDDLIVTTKGKYFFNKNINRSEITISLVPDLKFINGDTLMVPCEFLDLISLTDSMLILKTPTEVNYSFINKGVSYVNKTIKVRKERVSN